MPYRIRERDGEFCVVKINPDDSDGETEGCHENREEAQAQLTALNINVVAEEENAVHTDKPKKRKPKKKEIFGTDQSIDQQLNFIRRQFEDQFNPDNSIANVENYVWVNDIFDSFIIVDDEGKLFRVDYIMLDDEIIFSSKDRWVEVERGYRPKGFKVLKSNIKPRKKEMDDSTFFKRLKLAAKNILDIVTLAETEHKEVEIDILTSNYGIAQKEVNGELWHFTWSTNAFEDREKEIFSTKALENYVKEAEKKADRGYFNLWHINAEDGNFNTDFARKEWQGVVGRFLVEAGPYLDNEKGQAAKEFFSEYSGGHPEIAPEGWGCSPEFRYLPEERATGIYDNIWITRTSTLPKMAAANIWTDTRQLKRSEMLTEDQMKSAVALFGKDYVDSLLEEGNKRTEELENAGVAHKEKSEDTETEQEVQQVNIDMEELAAEVGKQFSANLDPIADAISTMTSTIKELQERLEKVESDTQVKAVTESPRFQFNLTRASESDKTVVTEDDKLNDRKPVETTKSGANDPWSQIFNK